jgi:DNA-binding MarR family transcriptional regulator
LLSRFRFDIADLRRLEERMKMSTSHPAAETYRRLYIAQTAVARAIERALLPCGISLPQAIALQVIGTAGEAITATQLAAYMGQERQSMTGLIDRMEAKGWLTRARDLPDRRAIRLELTAAGRAKLEEVTPVAFNAVVQVFERFDRERLAGMTAILQEIYEAALACLDEMPQEATSAAAV